ncbi:MAG: hypothetical protein H6571_17985 [Lewinellaceae bacterium]|nr:hypothetical protein [Bacteroidota bacterium]MCB9325634.1 hypothetical protein [Lewinellaceae bacterium]
MEGFYRTFSDIIQTIEEALEKERIVPCLILIFSAIDSFSFLAEKSDRTGRSVFKSWVKKWMLTKYPLPCNENDIYAARCGLLHQQVSESNLSKEGRAKQIYYSWGNSNHEILESAISKSNKRANVVAVKVEDLFWSFRKGLTDCKIEIGKDKNWECIFKEKAKKLFINVSS